MNKHERGPVREMVYKAGFVLAFVTLPLASVAAAKAIMAKEFVTAGIAGASAGMDLTQIRERNKPPEKQSWYNPEKITDKFIGFLRFFKGSASARMLKTDNLVHLSSVTSQSHSYKAAA